MYWRLFVFYAESGPIDTKPCVTCATAVWSICIGIHQTYLYITILTTLSKITKVLPVHGYTIVMHVFIDLLKKCDN